MKKLKDVSKRIVQDIKGYGFAGVIFFVYYCIVHVFKKAFCPLINVTGFPCAGCGLTRGFLYLLQGQFEKAAYINFMVFPIAVFLIYCGYFRYIKGTEIKGFNLLFAILMAGMLLFFFYRMYLYFPDRIPYVYAGDNVFANRIPGYQSLIQKLIKIMRASRM